MEKIKAPCFLFNSDTEAKCTRKKCRYIHACEKCGNPDHNIFKCRYGGLVGKDGQALPTDPVLRWLALVSLEKLAPAFENADLLGSAGMLKLRRLNYAQQELLLASLTPSPSSWDITILKEELPKLTDEEDSPLEQLQSRALVTDANVKKSLLDAEIGILMVVSGALLSEPNFYSPKPSRTKTKIMELGAQIAESDPEFLLKLGMYVRHVLNIRSTANYLLALAASLPPCQPYFLKWLRHVVRLPTDWLDIPTLYEKLMLQKQGKIEEKKGNGGPKPPLPASLRKALVRKFADFDAFTIAKYNKGKKTNKKKAGQEKNKKNVPYTLKQMVVKLHIARPAYIIMPLLGKRYPKNPTEFDKSGLPGKYEATRGLEKQRMKLPVADTWEMRVSKYGNIARTWEKLIDLNKLPFMAMIRNISNLLRAGVRPRYHEWVWKQLTNQRAVARSRILPFQFYSAFEAVDAAKHKIDADKKYAEMKEKWEEERKSLLTKQQLREEKIREQKRKRKRKNKNVVVFPEDSTYESYRTSLDAAMQLATVNNCSPIQGHTIVLCKSSQAMNQSVSAKGRTGSKVKSERTVLEVGILLGLMFKHVCENCDFHLYSTGNSSEVHKVVELQAGSILSNMQTVKNAAGQLGTQDSFPTELLMGLIRSRVKIDNLIVIADESVSPPPRYHTAASASAAAYAVEFALNPQKAASMVRQNAWVATPSELIGNFLRKYREEVNDDLLFVSVAVNGDSKRNTGEESEQNLLHKNDVEVAGYSDQILRFVGERGTHSQVQYVQSIDALRGIPHRMAKKQIPNPEKRRERAELNAVDILASNIRGLVGAEYDPCPNAAAGCPDRFKRDRSWGASVEESALEKHAKDACRYRLVMCGQLDCREMVLFMNLKAHQEKCRMQYHLKQSQGNSAVYQTVRFFISSTFRDMHGERQMMADWLMPALRDRVKNAGLKVKLVEVDLRWGVTEAESQKSLEICLDQVDKSDFFIAFLGQRYGYCPRRYDIADARASFNWLAEYPQNRSITELEIQHGIFEPWKRSQGLVDTPVIVKDVAPALPNKPVVVPYNPYNYKRPSKNHAFAAFTATAEVELGWYESPRPESEISAISESGSLLSDDEGDSGSEEESDHETSEKKSDFGRAENKSGNDLKRTSATVNHKAFVFARQDLDVPYEFTNDFHCSPEEQKKLNALKSRLSNAPDACLFKPYTAEFAGCGPDGAPRVQELDALGEFMLEELWNALLRQYPPTLASSEEPVPPIQPGELDLFAEREHHDAFMQSRVHPFVGRDDFLDSVKNWIDGEDEGPLLLTGIGGSGKSAVVTSLVRSYQAESRPMFCLPHFVGVSRASNSPRLMLLRLCHEIREKYELFTQPPIPTSFADLCQVFPRYLSLASTHSRVILVVDGIDKLESDESGASLLAWLPASLPSNKRIRLVLTYTISTEAPDMSLFATSAKEGPDTALEDDDIWASLKNREALPYYLTLPQLSLIAREDLVRHTLAEYRKVLDERASCNQMELLMEKREASCPMYLAVACQELRRFGSFENLTEYIRTLPETVPGLFEQFLSRMEEEHGVLLIQNVCALLALSNGGLLEHELLRLCGDISAELVTTQEQEGESEEAKSIRAYSLAGLSSLSKNSLARSKWMSLQYAFAPFLRPIEENSCLAFDSRQLQAAVRVRYLQNMSRVGNLYNKLASYFLECLDPNYRATGHLNLKDSSPRSLEMLPYYLFKANKPAATYQLLSHLGFIQKKCAEGMTAGLIEDLIRAIQPTVLNLSIDSQQLLARYQEELKLVLMWATKHIHVLALHPSLTFQLAANEPDVSPLAVTAHRLWRRDCNPERPQVVVNTDRNKLAYRPKTFAQAIEGESLFENLFEAVHTSSLQIEDQPQELPIPPTISPNCWIEHVNKPAVQDAIAATVSSTAPVHTLTMSDVVTAVALSANMLAVAIEDELHRIKLFRLSESSSHVTRPAGQCLGHTEKVLAMQFSASGAWLASASVDTTVRLWDPATCRTVMILAGHTRQVSAVSFSWPFLGKTVVKEDLDSDSDEDAISNAKRPVKRRLRQKIATSSWDGTVKVWLVPSKSAKKAQPKKDKSLFFQKNDNSTFAERLEKEKEAAVAAEAASADEDGDGAEDGAPRELVARKQQKSLGQFTGHEGPVNCVAFCLDGSRMVSAGWDAKIIIWDVDKEAELLHFQAGVSVRSVAFSPDTLHIVTSSVNGSIDIRDAQTGKVILALGKDQAANKAIQSDAIAEKGSDSGFANACTFSPDGRTLVAALQDGRVLEYDALGGCQLSEFPSQKCFVNAVCYQALSANAGLVVCGLESGVLNVWFWQYWVDTQACSHELLLSLEGHTAPITSAYVRRFNSTTQFTHQIATTSEDCTLRLWNLDMSAYVGKAGVSLNDERPIPTAECVFVARGHRGPVTDCAFSPDFSFIASASQDLTLIIWEVANDPETLIPAVDDQLIEDCDRGYLEARLGDAHSRGLLSCAWAGNYIASAGRDNCVAIWDARHLTLLSINLVHNDWITAVTFLQLDNTVSVVTSSWDFTVKVFALDSEGKLIPTPTLVLEDHVAAVSKVQVSPDNKTLVSASKDGSIIVFDAKTGRIRTTAVGNGLPINSVCFSNDNQHFLSAGDDGIIRVWNTSGGAVQRCLLAHADETTSICYGSQHMVSGGKDCTVKLWSTVPATLAYTLLKVPQGSDEKPKLKVSVCPVPVRPSTEPVVMAESLEVSVRSSIQQRQQRHRTAITSIAMSPLSAKDTAANEREVRLATSSRDGTIKLWDYSGHLCLATLRGHKGPVNSVRFFPNGKELVSGADDFAVNLWQGFEGGWTLSQSQSVHTDSVRCVDVSFDGKTVVSGSWDRTLIVWSRSKEKEPLTKLHVMGMKEWVESCAFSPRSSVVAVGTWDGSLRVVDVKLPKVVRYFPSKLIKNEERVKGHSRAIRSVQFSHDGNYLVTASADGSSNVYSVFSYAIEHSSKFHDAPVAFAAFLPPPLDETLSREIAAAQSEKEQPVIVAPLSVKSSVVPPVPTVSTDNKHDDSEKSELTAKKLKELEEWIAKQSPEDDWTVATNRSKSRSRSDAASQRSKSSRGSRGSKSSRGSRGSLAGRGGGQRSKNGSVEGSRRGSDAGLWRAGSEKGSVQGDSRRNSVSSQTRGGRRDAGINRDSTRTERMPVRGRGGLVVRGRGRGGFEVRGRGRGGAAQGRFEGPRNRTASISVESEKSETTQPIDVDSKSEPEIPLCKNCGKDLKSGRCSLCDPLEVEEEIRHEQPEGPTWVWPESEFPNFREMAIKGPSFRELVPEPLYPVEEEPDEVDVESMGEEEIPVAPRPRIQQLAEYGNYLPLITASGDRSVSLWNKGSKELERVTCFLCDGPVTALGVLSVPETSPAAGFIAAGDAFGNLYVLRPNTRA